MVRLGGLGQKAIIVVEEHLRVSPRAALRRWQKLLISNVVVSVVVYDCRCGSAFGLAYWAQAGRGPWLEIAVAYLKMIFVGYSSCWCVFRWSGLPQLAWFCCRFGNTVTVLRYGSRRIFTIPVYTSIHDHCRFVVIKRIHYFSTQQIATALRYYTDIYAVAQSAGLG